MAKYLSNAFSLQMCKEFPANIRVEKCATLVDEMPDLTHYESVIGHQDLANILGVPMNRKSITLQPGDELIVAQVMGGRLPEGTTVLPEGITIELLRVTIGYSTNEL
jgi:hypothetical protein